MTTTTSWTISGTYFESCNCDIACPCVFLQAPSTDDGDCNVVLAWNIESGSYGGTDVGGLNVALAAHSPGLMIEGNWKVALYIDERASAEQQEALGQIFSGQAGGHFEVLGGFISEVLGVSSAPIEYRSEGRVRGVTIGGVAEVQVEGLEGHEGADIKISGNPLGAVPGEPMVLAQSSVSNYSDHGMQWDNAGNNGYFSPFTYEG